jgi:hypothetical protein
MLDTLIAKSPLHFYAEHIGKTARKEETEAMQKGTLLHRCVLEPDTMSGAFYVEPETLEIDLARLKKLTSAKVVTQTADDKAVVEWNSSFKEADAWAAAHADRPIITREFAQHISSMRDAVWSHKVARELLKDAQTERCLFANDSKGTLRKARLDLIPRGGNTLADLKTCLSADDREMSKAIDKLGYYRQAAFTLALCEMLGMEWQNWCLICVENTPPHDVVVYPIDELAIRVGHNEIEGAIQTYRNCLETGKWPGRCEGLADAITLPSWRTKELEAA